MKIQCPCGAKYSFEITPEMGRTPVRFVCQSCGMDHSTSVQQIVTQQLSALTSQPEPGPTPALRVSIVTPTAAASAPDVQVCPRHAPTPATHRCVVCQKPICPKCMEIFGFVCSAYCKGKAENQGKDLPVYAGQRDVVQSRQWKKVGRIAFGVLLALVAVIGVWAWYAWVGSVPRVVYAARMTDPGFSGQLGPLTNNQVVFLHAGTLARHDARGKKAVWSKVLIDKPRLAAEGKALYEKNKADFLAAIAAGVDMGSAHVPDLEGTIVNLESDAGGRLHLHQVGEKVWVLYPDKIVRHDWQTGEEAQTVPLLAPGRSDFGAGAPRSVGEELIFVGTLEQGGRTVTRVNLLSGELTQEQLGEQAAERAGAVTAAAGPSSQPGAGSRPAAGGDSGSGPTKAPRPIDPNAVASGYQNLPTPAKLAVPAVLAANANQQRALAEMQDAPPGAVPLEGSRVEGQSDALLVSRSGLLEVRSKLLETKVVVRKAMKDPPKKSALNGDVNASSTAAVANEILNEMQRDRGGDTIQENVSRYQLTLHRPGRKGVEDWVGEVNGTAEGFPLESVDVVAAGKGILVFDRNNKKLWEATLNFPVHPAADYRFGFRSTAAPYGLGPCVERGDTLYVFDEGVLTSFDLRTGDARWRLPSVGTTGLFFDDRGMLYVNSTTATPDNLKYSRQIDVSDKLKPMVMRVDPNGGKVLWRVTDDGLVSHVAGKIVYTTEAHPGQGNISDNDPFAGLKGVFEIPAHIRLRRLAAGDGRVLWQHYEKRAPLDVRFERNTIEILFKREVELLRFLMF